jgi:MoaA/NifB/PqqE/SkfB family radical SAM enzyme
MECDHCFVWGGPNARGTFTLSQIRSLLQEARDLGTVKYISLEGGEPFLYYPIMTQTAKDAASMGFRVEILSNCYWATDLRDAEESLHPLAELGNVELTLSSDLYHGESWETDETRNAAEAAKILGMKVEVNVVKQRMAKTPCRDSLRGAKVSSIELMYKGRAAIKLADKASKRTWTAFTECPYEKLAGPERVHVDPFGHVHVCQGISIGNVNQRPFAGIIREYDPDKNPIVKLLYQGGPVALVKHFGLEHDEHYADACHLCYSARCVLRTMFPDTLSPDQMYGEPIQQGNYG